MPRDSKRPRLGRGLASLIRKSTDTPDVDGHYQPTTPPGPAAADALATPSALAAHTPMAATKANAVAMLPLANVRRNPYQPRRGFDEDALKGLAESIRTHGLLQPVVVTEAGIVEGRLCYELIAGERRLRASELAGVAEIPAIVRKSTPQQMLELALVENIHRADLNALERANAYHELMDRFGLTQQQVAEAVGEPRTTVANHVRLLDLADEVQKLIADGSLSFGHGKVLAGLTGRAQLQSELARRTVKGGLSVRELEGLIVESGVTVVADTPAKQPAPKTRSPYLADVERQLGEAIGTKVRIRPGRAKHSGKLVVEYYSLDDFDRIVAKFGVTLES